MYPDKELHKTFPEEGKYGYEGSARQARCTYYEPYFKLSFQDILPPGLDAPKETNGISNPSFRQIQEWTLIQVFDKNCQIKILWSKYKLWLLFWLISERNFSQIRYFFDADELF